MFNYEKKYLKYKNKYIKLRGGVSNFMDNTEKIIELIKKWTTHVKLLILVNKIKYFV